MIPPEPNYEEVDELTPISGEIEAPVFHEIWIILKSGNLDTDAYYSGDIEVIDTKAWQTVFRPTGQSDPVSNDPEAFFNALEGADAVSFFLNRERFFAAKIEATWLDVYSYFWFFADYDQTTPGEDVPDSGIPYFDPDGQRTGLSYFGEPQEEVEPEPPTPDPEPPDPGDPVLGFPDYSISYDEANDRIVVTIAQAVPDAEGYQLSYQINSGAWTADTNVSDALLHYINNGSQSAGGNPQVWFSNDYVRVGIRAREGVDNYGPWVYHQEVRIPVANADPPPPVPTGLSLSQPSNYSANITASWNASADATSYDYRYSINGGSYTGAFNVGSSLSAAIVATWNYGDSVRVTVRARNANGASSWSSSVMIIPSLAVPAAPTSLNLSWNEPASRIEASFTASAEASSYRYRWRRNSGTWSSYTSIGTATSFNVNSSGWVHNDSIQIEVQALNGAGSSSALSGTQAITITPPATPTGLSAIGQSTSAIGVTWNAMPRAVNYRLEYKAASSGTWILHSQPTGTSATLTGLAANTSYDVRVRAQNTGGNSAYSQTSAATLSVPPPIYTYTLSPGDNIQAVMNVINPGESVGFNPGNYNGKWSLSRSGTAANKIRLLSTSGRPEFRFFGTTGDGVSISGNHVRIEGAFRFRGAGTDGSGNRVNASQEHRGLFVSGNDVYINNVVSNGNNGSGVLIFNGQNFFVENSAFHDNYGLFSAGGDADGIQTGWQSTGTIRYCTMYNNSDDAWDAWNESTPLNGQIIIEFCAGWSNGRAASGDGNAWKPTNNCIIRNNLAWLNRMRGVENGGGQFTMTNQQFLFNTILQNGASSSGGGGMTISGNNHTIRGNVVIANWNWFQNQAHASSFNASNLTSFPGRVIGASTSDLMVTTSPGISGDIFWVDVTAANRLRIASGSPLQSAGPGGSRLGAY